jgi:hypothetical protein
VRSNFTRRLSCFDSPLPPHFLQTPQYKVVTCRFYKTKDLAPWNLLGLARSRTEADNIIAHG